MRPGMQSVEGWERIRTAAEAARGPAHTCRGGDKTRRATPRHVVVSLYFSTRVNSSCRTLNAARRRKATDRWTASPTECHYRAVDQISSLLRHRHV